MGAMLQQIRRFGASSLLFLIVAAPAAAWFPVDPLHGFDGPVTVNLRVKRWQITGAASFMPFNGINQYLNLGNDPLLNMGSHDFSVEAWVKFNGLVNQDPECTDDYCDEMSLLDKMAPVDSAANGDGWRLYKAADNRFRFCLGADTGSCEVGDGRTVQSITPAATGLWYHVVGCKTAGSLTIFINGRAQSTVLLGAYSDTGQADLLVGRNLALGAFLNGFIDTVGLYPRALTPRQVRELYTQVRRRDPDNPDPNEDTEDTDSTNDSGALQASQSPPDEDRSGSLEAASLISSLTSQLMVSDTRDRANSRSLDGATVTGPLHAFAMPAIAIRRVAFWLDDPTPNSPIGVPLTIEYLAPFDLAGTSASGDALAYDTRTLASGSHTVSARVMLTSGSTLPVTTATFRVLR
jgi:hypothetical protein